jgi:hypothetical protein
LSETSVRLSDLTAQLQKEREQSAKLALDMKSIISSDSEVRADVFREMTELAKTEPALRWYSNSLYQMAAVLLFRSRSSDEFMHRFLLIPAPSSVYSHFREELAASVTQLKSIDEIELYLISLTVQVGED